MENVLADIFSFFFSDLVTVLHSRKRHVDTLEYICEESIKLKNKYI